MALEHVAGFGGRRAAGAAQLRVDLVEPRFEDDVVRADEAVDAADLPLAAARGAVAPAASAAQSSRAPRDDARTRLPRQAPRHARWGPREEVAIM